jgi:cation:H+ antiporter
VSLIPWIVLVIVGFAVSVVASTRTVTHASALAKLARLPPFVVGLTLLAVGTDLPEMANSVVASASGHGDINVGDSVGSAATQATLVLGLLPFLGGALVTPGRRPFATGLFAALSLVVVGLLVADDQLSRLDGALLISMWLAGSWAAYRLLGRTLDGDVAELDDDDDGLIRRGLLGLLGRTFGGLLFVGAGATLAVVGAIEISEQLGASEFLISFFALSLGTSMPELVLDLTAARRGESALAVGDILGSSFVDTTLSIGIGPLLFPVAVTGSTIIPALIPAALAIAAVTVMLIRVERHERATGAFALALYALFYVVVL